MIQKFHVGQTVMLIAPFDISEGWGGPVPPIGSIGQIAAPMDPDGEYDVLFPGCPHPAINDPTWVTHWSAIIPYNKRCESTIYREATAPEE